MIAVTAERIYAMAPALYYIGIAIDIEYEKTGTVSPLVIEQLRNVINEPSSIKTASPTAAAQGERLPSYVGVSAD